METTGNPGGRARRSVVIFLGALCIATLASGAAFLWMRSTDAKAQGPLGEVVLSESDLGTPRFSWALGPSPDGQWFAHFDGFELCIRPIDPDEPAAATCIERDGLGFQSLAWSPDSNHVTGGGAQIADRDSDIWVVGVDGAATNLTDDGATGIRDIGAAADFMGVFSPDGESILFVRTTGGGDDFLAETMSIPASGGEPSPVASFPTAQAFPFVHRLLALGDGNYVASTSAAGRGEDGLNGPAIINTTERDLRLIGPSRSEAQATWGYERTEFVAIDASAYQGGLVAGANQYGSRGGGDWLVFDVDGGYATLDRSGYIITDVAFSPDGTYLAALLIDTSRDSGDSDLKRVGVIETDDLLAGHSTWVDVDSPQPAGARRVDWTDDGRIAVTRIGDPSVIVFVRAPE